MVLVDIGSVFEQVLNNIEATIRRCTRKRESRKNMYVRTVLNEEFNYV
jgi:hypothetical protein